MKKTEVRWISKDNTKRAVDACWLKRPEKVADGSLIRHFSYFKPTVKFLKELAIIPKKIQIRDFDRLAKDTAFTQTDVMEIFECNRDVARLILEKYFIHRYNYYYRRSELLEILENGKEELKI